MYLLFINPLHVKLKNPTPHLGKLEKRPVSILLYAYDISKIEVGPKQAVFYACQVLSRRNVQNQLFQNQGHSVC